MHLTGCAPALKPSVLLQHNSQWPFVQKVVDNGLDAIEKFARGVVSELLQQKQAEGGDARALVKAIITRLAGSLSSSMPSDAKHRQHFSCIAEWLQAGMKKKGLKMDCAGLTLAVFCFSQLLQELFPSLSAVCMAVRTCSSIFAHLALRASIVPVAA